MSKFSLAVLATTVAAQSCDDVSTESYFDEANAIAYKSEQGYYRGRESWYWEFGPRSAAAGPADNPGSVVGTVPIWVPQYANGTSAGSNIIDVMPCQDGYSDLWEVRTVTVADDYVADTYKSAEDVNAAVTAETATVEADQGLVNCPVVAPGSTLVDESSGDVDVNVYPLIQGWYQGQQVSYFDFGPVSGTDTEPVWVLKAESGEAGKVQSNIIDTVPGGESDQEPYTPFWQMVIVNVSDEFDAGDEMVMSAQEIQDNSDFTTEPQPMIVNCPVSWTAEATDDGDATDDDGTVNPSGAGQMFAGAFAIVLALI